jgi:hypothetical protein
VQGFDKNESRSEDQCSDFQKLRLCHTTSKGRGKSGKLDAIALALVVDEVVGDSSLASHDRFHTIYRSLELRLLLRELTISLCQLLILEVAYPLPNTLSYQHPQP